MAWPFRAASTIRHLLTHTSGIGGEHFIDTGRGDDNLEKYVATCAELPPSHQPEETLSYCNTGFSLLGRLVEKLDGKIWDETLKDRLIKPLGLTHTVTLPEEALLYRAAVGHAGPPDGDQQVVPQWVLQRSAGPAGLICATARDLLTFAQMHLEDGRASGGTQILSSASVKAMQQHQADIPDRFTLGDAWGLGWILFNWNGGRFIGHDGSTIGQSAFLRVSPERRVAIALLTNGGNTFVLYRDIFGALVPELTGAQVPPALELPATPPPLDLSLYEGTYERLNVRIELNESDGKLSGTMSYSGLLKQISPKPSFELEAQPIDATTFLLTTELLPEPFPMVFYAFDGDGRPRWMHMGARANKRVS